MEGLQMELTIIFQKSWISGLTKKLFLFSHRGSLINRRVPQIFDNNKEFDSARLCDELCETQRDI